MSKITFSSIDKVIEAKDADVFICMAEPQKHPYIHYKNENDFWAKKEYYEILVNDETRDERYRSFEKTDLKNMSRILTIHKGKWIHINCLMGLSRSAAMTIFCLLFEKGKPTLDDFKNIQLSVIRGENRIPQLTTFPNDRMCNMICDYFNI